jgi:alpha-L-fucosidase
MIIKWILLVGLIGLMPIAAEVTSTAPAPFEPNWESIAAHYQIPTWYRDAKFGIFIHWGVYAVPAYHDEWYPRWMYLGDEKSRIRVFDYHVKTYGPQDKFGYKDFIPQFKAEKWDPKAWAQLFKESGAQYVVPVAEHHDGFAMYDSVLSPWTSVKMGPKRDIIGELRTALLAEGLHFGLSSHRAEHWWFFSGGREFPSDVQDPRNASLYGPAQSNRKDLNNPEGKAFLEDWLARGTELVDKYQPELVYFDVVGSWAPQFQPYLKRFVAHYYNASAQLNRGSVVNYKTGLMPDHTGVLDFERDVSETARADYWQTDTSVGKKSWSHTRDEEFKSPKQLINEFVDVVSKNGNYLLNIGPRADGTIPEEPRQILQAFGAWLKVNGEAIYGSRPTAIAGEGPTKLQPKGPGRDKVESPYGASDFRFTQKNGVLYAIALGWPKDGAWTINSLASGNTALLEGEIERVELLGSTGKLEWTRTAKGLEIKAPTTQPCEHAFVFRVTTKSVKPFLPPSSTQQ